MKFLYSHPKFKTEKLNKNDEKFLQLLEEDSFFEREILRLRKKYKIPKEGLNLEDSIFDNNNVKNVAVMGDLFVLIFHYEKLPMSWAKTFLMILWFNLAVPPDKEHCPPLTVYKEDAGIVIKLYENIPIKQICKLIKNDENFKELIKTLPKNPEIKTDNIPIKKRMLELKNQGLSLSEIGDKLTEEFGTLSFEADDYNVLGSELSRFRNEIIKKTDTSKKRESEIKRIKYIFEQETKKKK